MFSLIGIPRDDIGRLNNIYNGAYPAINLIISSNKPTITLNTYWDFGIYFSTPLGGRIHRPSMCAHHSEEKIVGSQCKIEHFDNY